MDNGWSGVAMCQQGEINLMQSWTRFLFKAFFVASCAFTAAGFGLACIALINLAPVALWGEGVLLFTPFLTVPLSIPAGGLVYLWCYTHQMEWLDAGFTDSQRYPSKPQLIVSSIGFVAGLAALHIAVNGFYPKNFDLAWREEIRLGNGGRAVVETRRTYERLDFLRLSEFKNVRLNSSQLNFEPTAGEPRVSITTPLQPVYLNQIDGVWYLVLADREDSSEQMQPKTSWGKGYNTLGQRLMVLKGRAFEASPWEAAPTAIVFRNLLSADIFDLAKARAAEKHLVTLAEKQTLAYRYVNTSPGPDPLRITRNEAMKAPLLAEYQEAIAGLIKPP
jgi:hypothetical protein